MGPTPSSLCTWRVQRSWAKARPAARAISPASSLTHPGCSHSDVAPTATIEAVKLQLLSRERISPAQQRLIRGGIQLAEDIHHVDGLVDLGEGVHHRHAQHVAVAGAHRNDLVALLEQVLHHAVRGLVGVGRRTDHRDGARSGEDLRGS